MKLLMGFFAVVTVMSAAANANECDVIAQLENSNQVKILVEEETGVEWLDLVLTKTGSNQVSISSRYPRPKGSAIVFLKGEYTYFEKVVAGKKLCVLEQPEEPGSTELRNLLSINKKPGNRASLHIGLGSYKLLKDSIEVRTSFQVKF